MELRPKIEIKVTRIGSLRCCRLSTNEKPWAQNWVRSRQHIDLACKDLMRGEDKLITGGAHTYWTRHRQRKENERYYQEGCHANWLVKGGWL